MAKQVEFLHLREKNVFWERTLARVAWNLKWTVAPSISASELSSFHGTRYTYEPAENGGRQDRNGEEGNQIVGFQLCKSMGGYVTPCCSLIEVCRSNQLPESSVPPAILATLIAAQHLQPPQFLPLLFPPVLMFSSYLSLLDRKVDAAGTSAAWSGLYLLLARRRKQKLRQKWSVRGIVRGTTMGVCAVNLAAGGLVYAINKRNKEPASEGDSSTT